MTLTAAQKQAISPQNSVWVEASAGSGKTKVLIDRLLALLCDGTPPERLLCVTFTKAAAAEMRQRLMQRLSLWSHLAPAELGEAITALGLQATPNRLQRARTLFDEVLALSKGLRIQTLHSFAESLLKSFPLEAGVLPTFDVMDEAAAKQLLQTTLTSHLQNALHNPQRDPLWPAIELLSQKLSESAFEDCFHEILSKRSSFTLDRLGDATTLKALARALDLSPEETKDTLQAFSDKLLAQLITSLPIESLRAAATLLSTQDKEALRQKGAVIKNFCNAPDLLTFQAFVPLWLTDKGTPRKTIFAKEVVKQLNAAACFTQDAGEALSLIQDKVWCAAQKLKVKMAFDTSKALQTLGRAFLKDYRKRKRQKGVLDYDDLLQHACHLLKHDDGWVLYKLGHGLDHILIDEAQDTSALGWQLIEGLMDVFFTGDDSQKTLFVVGDPKQSIYSFQGADPTLFYTMRDTFERRIKQMGWPFKKLSLTVSFRAAPVVLQAVDAVFAQPLARKGLGEQTVVHKAHKDIAGSVTLWPLVQEQAETHANAHDPAASDSPPDPLDGLQKPQPFFSGQAQLAFKIALYIKENLEKPLWLSAQGRPLAAGDIMILLRKRGPFMPLLVRFLKDFDLPVMGQDRLVLTQALVIQDMLALLKCCITLEDDLTLATVLKGPLIGLSEDHLMQLALRRLKHAHCSLWSQLKSETEEPFAKAALCLTRLQKLARTQTVFDFYAHVLWREGGLKKCAARLGGDVYDLLDAFLAQALVFSSTDYKEPNVFLAFFEQTDLAIKRDIAAHSAQGIHILTVHGAKGLEAPLVILPDAAQNRRPNATCLWMPLFHASTQAAHTTPFAWVPLLAQPGTQALEGVLEQAKNLEDDEYNRLLYVALTRAVEHLVIAGHSSQKVTETTWYEKTRHGLLALDATEQIESAAPEESTLTLCLRSRPQNTPQAAESAAAPASALATPAPLPLPVWARTPVPQEEAAPLVLTPSGVAAQTASDPTPRTGRAHVGAENAKLRGTLIHALLEQLSPKPPTTWEAVKQLVATMHAVTKDQMPLLEEAFLECTALLTDPTFAFLKSSHALRELPFCTQGQASAFLKGNAVAANPEKALLKGRIDFVLPKEEVVWVLDFKTDRTPPSALPRAYQAQLSLYEKALQPLFKLPLRLGVLWTKTKQLTWQPPVV